MLRVERKTDLRRLARMHRADHALVETRGQHDALGIHDLHDRAAGGQHVALVLVAHRDHPGERRAHGGDVQLNLIHLQRSSGGSDLRPGLGDGLLLRGNQGLVLAQGGQGLIVAGLRGPSILDQLCLALESHARIGQGRLGAGLVCLCHPQGALSGQ